MEISKGFKSNFMFSFNEVKPECCPSTYTSSGGCVCVNEKQKEFLSSRGNNHSN